MGRKIREVFFEVAGPVLPVALLVVFLQLVVVKVPSHLFARFGIGVAFVIAGLFLFLIGVRLGLIPLGEYIGANLPARVRPWLLVGILFVLGFAAAVAEPDVRVLADVVRSASSGALSGPWLIPLIGVGLGLGLAGGVLRQILGIRTALVFGVGWAIILAISPFVSQDFVAISLDSGWTTTGPLVVPLIMALGLGVAGTLAGRSSLEEAFGLVGIASMGPAFLLIAVGLFT